MRLKCPLCGDRDRREYYYYGAEDYLDRPAPDAALDAWDNYLHLRDNPAGMTRDLWYHEAGCSQWLLVSRNTTTHAILAVELVAGRTPLATPAPMAEIRPEPKPAAKAAARPASKPATKIAAKPEQIPAAKAAKSAPKAAAKTVEKAKPKSNPTSGQKTGQKT